MPWPFTASTAAAEAMGWHSLGSHAALAPDAVRALAKPAPGDRRARFPQLAAYRVDLFDYAVEDAVLGPRPPCPIPVQSPRRT